MVEPKNRRVFARDWDRVEEFVNDELKTREKADFRREHEKIWKEVDRQLQMREMQRVTADGKPVKWTWQNAMELGELAKAQEIICADVMRIMFPADRSWFQPHVKLNWPTGQNGMPKTNPDQQKKADGLLRNLMAQQHKDFGFKDRFELSVKEALAHGSFVAEIRWQKSMMVKEDRVREVSSPVWVPYSMWNAFPDPSASVIGGEIFYPGSMMVREYTTFGRFKQMVKDRGWMAERAKKVEKRTVENKENKTDQVEILTFCGDIFIDRSDEDIYLPNSKVILANGVVVAYEPNRMPYSPFIYGGYERQDVRDPLWTSPIIKLSPIQKAATIVVNKFLDAVALKVEPPVEYDGNDPDYVMTDGPVIAPGAKNPRKGGKAFESLDIGDPRFGLDAIQLFFRQLQEGLGVSSLRSGTQSADRQTATEASLLSQGAEVRTMEFISNLERKLLPFLYMQHELNRRSLEGYQFYNDVVGMPDYITASKKDIDADVVFEVVGAKGILGEKERNQNVLQTVAFLSQNPLFASSLKSKQIAQDLLGNAGKKNPEEWIEVNNAPDPRLMQMQQVVQELAGKLKEAESEMAVKVAKVEEQSKKWQADSEIKMQQVMNDRMRLANDVKSKELERLTMLMEVSAAEKQRMADAAQAVAEARKAMAEAEAARQLNLGLESSLREVHGNVVDITEKMGKTKKVKSRKVKRTTDGYEITEVYDTGETGQRKVKRTADGFEVS